MITTYRSLEEAHKADLPPPIEKVVCRCLQDLMNAYGGDYDPDDDGHMVLFSQDTTDEDAFPYNKERRFMFWACHKTCRT